MIEPKTHCSLSNKRAKASGVYLNVKKCELMAVKVNRSQIGVSL